VITNRFSRKLPTSQQAQASLLTVLLLFVLAACRSAPVPAPIQIPASVPPPPTITPAPTLPPVPTPTPTPSPTPEPLAARVNGQPIRLADYQAELARCQAAAEALTPSPSPTRGEGSSPVTPSSSPTREAGIKDESECQAQALQALIDQALILQASQQVGISVSDAQLEAEFQATVQAAGGDQAFNAWLVANHWTPDAFRTWLRSQLLAQMLAERAIATIPAKVEQVHARHILVATEAQARDLRDELVGGSEFARLAQTYSLDLTTRLRGGDLGWFARGELTAPELEAMAFSLAPGALGDVVHSSLGYHVVQTLERDPARPLSAEQQAELRRQALEQWLAKQRAGAQIERLLPE